MQLILVMRNLLLVLLLIASTNTQARGVYQHPDAFLDEVFAGQTPKPKFIWFTGETRKTATTILQHKPVSLRSRYWKQDKRSVWILEEIGKEKPITVGFVINNNKIEKVKVLIFRESRGWEIKRSDFTRQFNNARLDKKQNLTQTIDGISGATLSVKAVTRLSRLSLYLHSLVSKSDGK